jgi:dihydropteroate synthase
VAGGLPLEQRLEGTIAACVVAVLAGARILRVHDVAPVRRAIALAEAVRLAAAD